MWKRWDYHFKTMIGIFFLFYELWLWKRWHTIRHNEDNIKYCIHCNQVISQFPTLHWEKSTGQENATITISWFFYHVFVTIFLGIWLNHSLGMCMKKVIGTAIGPSVKWCSRLWWSPLSTYWPCPQLTSTHSGLQQSARPHIQVSVGDEKWSYKQPTQLPPRDV